MRGGRPCEIVPGRGSLVSTFLSVANRDETGELAKLGKVRYRLGTSHVKRRLLVEMIAMSHNNDSLASIEKCGFW